MSAANGLRPYFGDLVDYSTGKFIRAATEADMRAANASVMDGGAFKATWDGRTALAKIRSVPTHIRTVPTDIMFHF
jgi:hypothetical protein